MDTSCSVVNTESSTMTKISYKTDLPGQDQFFRLFLTTGWNKKYQLEKDQLHEAIKHSWYCHSAYIDEKLVGFGRIICDGVVHALILDLIVDPDYRKRGIGRQILKSLIEKCQDFGIRDIQLFCAKGYAGFYEKHGFHNRPEDAPGMEYHS